MASSILFLQVAEMQSFSGTENMGGSAHLRTTLSSTLSMLTTYSIQDLPRQKGLTSPGLCLKGKV